ncbi:MAG: hypothetical protein AVO34_05760 [Firmicutes bacterium ML8_F2]|jgi:uncharacterized protein YebE (UPF0316 family)|nr:MAG: hypothetical protein AVO34_05760 [Firmicutes bacterium ML8_F2]
MSVFLTLVVIFFAKIAHVSLGTLRIIYLTRGKSVSAAAVGFFEVIIYLIALNMVLTNIDQWYNILVYGFGYAAGNIVGGWIEEKIAVGIVHAQIIIVQNGGTLEELLRDQGYGVTSMPCYGKEGAHRSLQVLLKRKEMPEFNKIVKAHDPNAFITVFDTRSNMGGYFARMKAK